MKKPIVAVVGRPNVGKSTLFNALIGARISITDDTPGVTRDRIYADCDWGPFEFTLIDTGGIEPVSEGAFLSEMRQQAEVAVSVADVVIFVTDVHDGVTDADTEIAKMLRKSAKPVVLSVNKVDNFKKQRDYVYEFYELALGDPVPVSALGKQGLGDLLDEVTGYFTPQEASGDESDAVRVAVIGRPNVGKSSVINKLLGEERLIVSERAGTTRDAVDTMLRRRGTDYVFVDTAGLRRKSKIADRIERYSVVRTVAAAERADICIIVIDAEAGVTEQDAKIAGIAHEKGRGSIILVNKWDLVPDKDTGSAGRFTKELESKLSFMPYAPVLFVSALTGQRLPKIFDLVDRVRESQLLRVKSGVLNEVLLEAAALHEPPQDKGRRLRMFYITEAGVEPPTFVIFVNDRELFHFSYMRYIENKLREAFGFEGTPIRIVVRERESERR